jgi:hypothetical protein
LQAAVVHEETHHRVHDALGHAPRNQRRVSRHLPAGPEDRVRLSAVTFVDHLAAMHDDQGQTQPVRRVFGEQLVGDL